MGGGRREEEGGRRKEEGGVNFIPKTLLRFQKKLDGSLMDPSCPGGFKFQIFRYRPRYRDTDLNIEI